MKLNILVSGIAFVLTGCIQQYQGFLCFSDPKTPKQRVCYPENEDNNKVAIVRDAVKNLGQNIENPGSLVKLQGEMADRYTEQQFRKSVKRYFDGIGPSSIAFTLTHGTYTAVLLKGHSTLYYEHDKNAFIFSYESPVVFEGAGHFYGRGIDPIRDRLGKGPSNCSLVRDGIVFESEAKPNLHFNDEEPFCEYSGYFFKKDGNKVKLRRIDQIGLGYSEISATGFAAFLRWMKTNP